MKPSQIAGALKRAKLLTGLDADDLRKLAELMEEYSFDPGKALYSAGERGDSMYVLASGRVEFYADVQGRSTLVAQVGPVNTFGELSLLLPGPRMMTAKAREEVSVYVMTAGSLSMLQRSDMGLSVALLEVLRNRVAQQLNECKPYIGSLFAAALSDARQQQTVKSSA